MSTKRVIKLKLLTQTNLEVFETEARTFGEFKSEISQLGIDWKSAKLIDRATKTSFEVDEAILPATNAVMFVMPTKSKAGADLPYKEVKKLVKEYKANGGNVPFNYTRATTKDLNKFWDSVQAIKEVSSTVESAEEVETITLTTGKYLLDIIGDAVVEAPVELMDDTTLEDLDGEAKDLEGKF